MNYNVDARFSVSPFRHRTALIKMLVPYLLKTRRAWVKNARSEIQKLDLDKTEKKHLYRAYRRDYTKYRPTFKEYYYSYRFPNLTEDEKQAFLTMRDTQLIARKYRLLYREQWIITGRKQRFLEEYAPFVHRKWMLVDSGTDPEEIQRFLDSFDVIAKPTNAASGKGVHKILRGQGDAQEVLKGKLPMLLEECLKNEASLAAFHPSSVNTVRVTTLSNGKEVRVFGTVLRTGNQGSVFDNADAGGFFAEIDPETGIVISNGVNEWGKEVEAHPASGTVFKGFQIPRWDEVIGICTKAALRNPLTTLMAWDVAITPQDIELIEANSIPSIEIHQVPRHKGVRRKLYETMDELGLPYRDVMFWTKLLSRLHL